LSCIAFCFGGQCFALIDDNFLNVKSSLLGAYGGEPSFYWILPILIIGRRVGASEVTSIDVNIYS
jgi:hypothetical protein